MQRLLSASDLLPRSEAALIRSGILAEGLGAELLLLHVVAPTESSRVLEKTLQWAIAQMHARTKPPLWPFAIEPEILVRAGSPARWILQTTLRSRADLLILGPHRSRGIRDALEGTIVSKVLATRACPVLIVQKPPLGAYRNVMLALDDSPASAAALRTAEPLVLSNAVDAKVVHAIEAPCRGMLQSVGVSASSVESYTRGWMRQAANRIRDVLEYHSTAFSQYEIVIEEGRAAPGIVQAVQRCQPDLLILGTGAHGRLHRAFLGSVANEVLLRATCDVLIVPEVLTHECAEEKPITTRERTVKSAARGSARA